MSEIYRVTKAAPPGIEPGKASGQTKPQLCVIAHDVAEKTGAANSVESVSSRTIPPRSKNAGTGKGPIVPLEPVAKSTRWRPVGCDACNPHPATLGHPDWCKCRHCGCCRSSHPGPFPDLVVPPRPTSSTPIGDSFSGRTAAFEAVNPGSIPGSPAVPDEGSFNGRTASSDLVDAGSIPAPSALAKGDHHAPEVQRLVAERGMSPSGWRPPVAGEAARRDDVRGLDTSPTSVGADIANGKDRQAVGSSKSARDLTALPSITSEWPGQDRPSPILSSDAFLARSVTIAPDWRARLPAGERKPVCATCNDTHNMTLRDREVMCTRCPIPCKRCRRRPQGPFCAVTPCPCACHDPKEAP